MAFLLFSFCSFTSHKTLIKDVHAHRTDRCSLVLNTSTCLTGMNFLAPRLCGEELLSMKRHHNPATVAVAVAVFLDCKIVYTPRVIYGFWVGPEYEDGWGFVEAFVNQMFET